jgi:hypothetical protein
MGRMDEIGFEYRFSIGMGAVALVLSLLAGIAAGNSMGGVLMRSVVFTAVFAAVGFGVVFVVRKYVPEFYEFITSMRASATAGAEMPKVSVAAERDGMAPGPALAQDRDLPDADIKESLHGEEAAGGKAGGFTPFKQSDFTTMSSVRLNEGKLGKHLLEEKIVKYEPKIMAEAIRTMMGRDKE